MFIRRKHNRSGTISVVVVDKSGGSFKEIHRVGIAHNEEEALSLEAAGRHWIATYGGQQLIDFEGRADKELRRISCPALLQRVCLQPRRSSARSMTASGSMRSRTRSSDTW